MLALDLGSCSSSHAKEGYYKLGRPRWYVRCQTAGLNLGCNPAPLCKVSPIGQRVGSGSLKSLLLIFQGQTSASTSHGLRPPKKNDLPLPTGISYNRAGLLLFFFGSRLSITPRREDMTRLLVQTSTPRTSRVALGYLWDKNEHIVDITCCDRMSA